MTTREDPDWSALALLEGELVVNASIRKLLSIYTQWRACDLREVVHAHEIRVHNRDTVVTLIKRLLSHTCSRHCPTVIVIFRPLQRHRTELQVQRNRDVVVQACARAHQNYMEVASDELRRSIISEWQEAFSTERFQVSVCGPCGRRTLLSKITLVSTADFDLNLLRNDGLPAKVRPTTYDFEAYQGALLHPKGLVDLWQVGDVRMCEVCQRELVGKGRMPRLCLANYLYYAYNELPPRAKEAFDASSYTEHLMLARARCSKISYRFTELGKGTDDLDDTAKRKSRPPADVEARSQRCTKGNVLVMPQNSTHLNSVIPPPPETVRDTVCAVFVGKSKPTKDTIWKLGPLLVRKSRLLPMIEFITSDNPHYACDTEFHGFSQRNLDILFGPGTEDQDEGVPCALEVGFIEDSEAIRASVSGYDTRDEHDDEPSSQADDAILMENVGYTMSDQTPVSYRDMKMKALAHCLSGGRFIRSQGGDRFVPDFDNPSLLTWLFPHLDPWGIGGFHEPARLVPITMEEQLKYLLELDDSPFERDPDFAFVYYNILQKKAVCDSVRFRVKVADQTRVVRDLLSVDKDELERLIRKFKADPKYEPETEEQKRLVNIVNKVGTMLHDLPGTAGYKLKMRNEIRSLVNMRGTPAFFITLNPSDVNHPLVRLLAGDDIQLEHLEAGQELTKWDRKLLVAQNPGACARFFHTMISSFVSIVLRYGKKEKGLLGKCTAYYGTVETQGRGTLHCHMLIWLEGHPSPQEMRDLMVNSAQYQADMFTWLESIIKCELLGTTMVIKEPNSPLPRPKHKKTENYVDPGTTLGPSISEVPLDQFWLRFASDVNDVVLHTNWHQHTETCWKNLRRGAPRTDENCRMRMDGTTREETTIDEESGSILLRRLHPRIANYNDLIIFLIRANMEIKHIGSGQGSKALIYYITDYITKASLPAHVGLAALLYAINRTNEKYKDIPNWQETRSTGALTVVVNSMMARQEISHQQVMSYIIGGGDHYTSDKFRVLYHASFDRLVARHWLREEDCASTSVEVSSNTNVGRASQSHLGEPNTTTGTINGPTNLTVARVDSLRWGDDLVTLLLGAGSISAVNQQHDYIYRPATEPFNSMGLFEYVGMTEKITKDAESRRILHRQHQDGPGTRRGRPEEMRAEFGREHPQHGTHVVRKRTVWVVPVLLGERMPRPDRNDDEREQWARTVLTLFMPWRHPSDLKDESETWYDAYERYEPAIPPEHKGIIHNMNVLSECKDARDKASLARDRERNPALAVGDIPPPPDPFDVYESRANAGSVSHGDEYQLEYDDMHQSMLTQELDKNIGTRFRHAIDRCFIKEGTSAHPSSAHGSAALLTEDKQAELIKDRSTMRQLKRKRRPDDEHEHIQDADRNVRPRLNRPPIIDSMQLDEAVRRPPTSLQDTPSYDRMDLMHQVVLEKNLLSNPEQLRAFEIVGNHVLNGGAQLLMYIGGVGGTGKSHVVNSILRLFSLLGKRNTVLVAAPTGAAAILIGGHTIHSLTLLPDGPGRNLQELCKIWENVEYLILDEISMIGAKFLSQLNARMMRAKGYDEKRTDMPFGGVNVIFTGDFGQLRPVRDASLYSHSLVNHPSLASVGAVGGISAAMGVCLWRKVSTVVQLKINQRQAGDRTYADMLSRIRIGQAKTHDEPDAPSDFMTLTTRYADRVSTDTTRDMSPSQYPPIIVGRRKLRDLLNLRIMGHLARHLSATVHLYHARDKVAGRTLTKDDRELLWKVGSTTTNDSLGKLPLFPGMKVMVQENLAFTKHVVNGTEGTVKDIVYEEEDGKRYPAVVYVHIPGSGRICSNADDDIVPIFPELTSFVWSRRVNGEIDKVSVSRLQLPLLPAYAYTDYKSQGRSLDHVIVDPESAASLQGVYVMLSRVRALEGLHVLRPFKATKIEQRLSQELRTELSRLDDLDTETQRSFTSSFGNGA